MKSISVLIRPLDLPPTLWTAPPLARECHGFWGVFGPRNLAFMTIAGGPSAKDLLALVEVQTKGV